MLDHVRQHPRIGSAGAGAALFALLLALLVGGCSSTAPARQSRLLVSIFQDDNLLIYAPTRTVERTLGTLAGAGVDQVRVTVLWQAIAPDPFALKRPRHFNARDPGAYPAALWVPFDRLVALAAARHIGVDFDVTAPGPLWAMVHPAPKPALAARYRPAPSAFGAFVAAVGRRYSGSYVPRGLHAPLPRVSSWSIWNEPNQPGWLAPQWRTVARRRVPDSPRLYRLYLDAAFAALAATGHTPSSDTLLIGELAPEGKERNHLEDPIPPMPFLRALYCVGSDYKPLRGQLAALLHCPLSGSRSAFVAANPGLFNATGFAHHPYSFYLPPTTRISDPSFVPLADLDRLETGLDRIFAAYGVARRLPIYLTEYGYETFPPNPYRGVPPATQARYLDEGEYLAWKDPRVRAMTQFLLVDSPPDRAFRRGSIGYWATFQTGLRYLNGANKPSFSSYRLPVFLPTTTFHRGTPVLVWGMLRMAPDYTTQRASIQWRPAHGGGRFVTIARTTTSDPDGFLTANVVLPGSGTVRLEWISRRGRAFHSRAVPVREA